MEDYERRDVFVKGSGGCCELLLLRPLFIGDFRGRFPGGPCRL